MTWSDGCWLAWVTPIQDFFLPLRWSVLHLLFPDYWHLDSFSVFSYCFSLGALLINASSAVISAHFGNINKYWNVQEIKILWQWENSMHLWQYYIVTPNAVRGNWYIIEIYASEFFFFFCVRVPSLWFWNWKMISTIFFHSYFSVSLVGKYRKLWSLRRLEFEFLNGRNAI